MTHNLMKLIAEIAEAGLRIPKYNHMMEVRVTAIRCFRHGRFRA